MRKGGERLTIFKVEKYLIKPEKQEEYMAMVKKWEAYIKKNKETMCRELKSWRLLSDTNTSAFVEMGEFESLADFEKIMDRIEHDKEFLTEIMSPWMSSMVPGSYSMNMWKPVP